MFILCAAIILLIAVGFRFFVLEQKAVHHDESVNYAFSKKLAEKFHYHYNPSAYHGPFLYFIGLPAYKLFEPSKFVLRMTPALFGVLAVIFMLLMRRTIGTKGALFGGLVLALSPADVYFSRTFIHEIYFACFSTATLWSFLEYTKEPRRKYLFTFFISLAFCFTVKETSAVMVVSMVAAFFTTRLYFRGLQEPSDATDNLKLDWKQLWGEKLYVADAMAIGLTIIILLFTSFLTYPRGWFKFFEAFLPWFDTGFKNAGGHSKPFYYFFLLGAKYYAPIVIPALMTGIWSLGKQKPRGVFLFLYGMFMLIIYSSIPYKTPWCLIQIWIPFIALAGYGISKATKSPVPKIVRWHVFAYLLVFLIPYAFMSYYINFVHYDNDKYKIVYVQTIRSFEDQFDLLDLMATRSGQGKSLPLAIIKAKNPTRHYLRDYTDIKKYEEVPEEETFDRPVIFVRSTLQDKAEEALMDEYIPLSYPVWPGTFFVMLVEKEFYSKYAKEEL